MKHLQICRFLLYNGPKLKVKQDDLGSNLAGWKTNKSHNLTANQLGCVKVRSEIQTMQITVSKKRQYCASNQRKQIFTRI